MVKRLWTNAGSDCNHMNVCSHAGGLIFLDQSSARRAEEMKLDVDLSERNKSRSELFMRRL